MFVTWIVILRTILIFLTLVLVFLDQDSLRRDFLRDSTPQNPKFHRLDPFFMMLMQFGLHNSNCISTNSEHVCNMDSHFKDNINLPNSHLRVFMILSDRFLSFFLLGFLVVFKSKIQNCWNERYYDCWLYINTVRIMKSKLQGAFLEILQGASNAIGWKK
jgi:hypothetical protein